MTTVASRMFHRSRQYEPGWKMTPRLMTWLNIHTHTHARTHVHQRYNYRTLDYQTDHEKKTDCKIQRCCLRRSVWWNEVIIQSSTGLYMADLFWFVVYCISLSLSLSLSRFNGHFTGEPELAGVYRSKGWWRWWWQLDYRSHKPCKVPVLYHRIKYCNWQKMQSF